MPQTRSLWLLCCFVCLAGAQTSKSPKSAPPPPGVIHSVAIQGNKLYQTADILKVLDLKTGAPVSPAGLKAAQGRLAWETAPPGSEPSAAAGRPAGRVSCR